MVVDKYVLILHNINRDFNKLYDLWKYFIIRLFVTYLNNKKTITSYPVCFFFRIKTYEKSFQEKVALFKILISSTKYTFTCVRVCTYSNTILHQRMQSMYKEMMKHSQNILLHVYKVNVNTQLHNTNVVVVFRNL